MATPIYLGIMRHATQKIANRQIMPYQIYPSLLSCDLARLGDEALTAINAGATGLHIDAMDNHYVPNLTFGPWICQALRQFGITAPLDVHLMVEPVDQMISGFAKSGASAISFHPEASLHVDRSLSLIRDAGCEAGLALNPATGFGNLDYILDKLDFILIMSVNPGFGGQRFLPNALLKIKALQQYLHQRGASVRIAVDGGVHLELIQALALAGATQFIIGSALYQAPGINTNLAAFQQQLHLLSDDPA